MDNINNIILPKDIYKICESYLSSEEVIYYEKKWKIFDRDIVCWMAAENGWLDLLKWARLNGCDWDSYTCSEAARCGHLEVLKWARENGCDWNSLTCCYAAENGHLEVLKWLKLNGCMCGGVYHKKI